MPYASSIRNIVGSDRRSDGMLRKLCQLCEKPCAIRQAHRRFQLVQQKLANMLTEITKAQLLTHRLGTLKNEGKMRPEQVSLAKRNNVQMALEIARSARDLHGANGILASTPLCATA